MSVEVVQQVLDFLSGLDGTGATPILLVYQVPIVHPCHEPNQGLAMTGISSPTRIGDHPLHLTKQNTIPPTLDEF